MDREVPSSNSAKKLNRRQALRIGLAATATGFSARTSSAEDRTSLVSTVKRMAKPESELRQRAISDYRQSMQQFGGSLSTPIDRLLQSVPSNSPCAFDVLVIGSGYGASICAARLASKLRPGKRLGVLERGRERIPGEFGSNLPAMLGESMRPVFRSDKRSIKNPLGLIDLRQGDDVSVMSASGLGGTSLINANVAIRPDRDVFSQLNWPSFLKNRDFLDPYYDRVAWELGAQQDPVDHTAKMRTQRIAAENLRD